MRLRVRAPSLGQLTIRLADSLVVRSVDQRSVRPAVQPARDESEHDSRQPAGHRAAGHRDDPDDRVQRPTRAAGARARDRDAAARSGAIRRPEVDDPFVSRPEPTFLYSNMSYWYPQSTVTDYATATIQITVPGDLRLRRERRAAIGFAADDSAGRARAPSRARSTRFPPRGRSATSRFSSPS